MVAPNEALRHVPMVARRQLYVVDGPVELRQVGHLDSELIQSRAIRDKRAPPWVRRFRRVGDASRGHGLEGRPHLAGREKVVLERLGPRHCVLGPLGEASKEAPQAPGRDLERPRRRLGCARVVVVHGPRVGLLKPRRRRAIGSFWLRGRADIVFAPDAPQ